MPTTTIVIGLLIFANACFITASVFKDRRWRRLVDESCRALERSTETVERVARTHRQRQAEVEALRALLWQIGYVVDLDWRVSAEKAHLSLTVNRADQPLTVQ